uniref:Uncharacterized protein n=1 Tax=Anguilla anguilla TaxID=7936 RepID=A0A0E9WJ09_ANGAN
MQNFLQTSVTAGLTKAHVSFLIVVGGDAISRNSPSVFMVHAVLYPERDCS